MTAPTSTLLHRRLTLPKFLYRTAKDAIDRPHPPHSWGLATSLLQDSVEALLRLVAEEHRIKVDDKAPFGTLLSAVEQQLPNVADHRANLTKLNTIRVAFKHRGLEVAERDAQAFVVNVEAFLTETYKEAFDVDFASLSLADSIGHRRTQNWVAKAEDAFAAESYAECVAHAAKALIIYMDHSTSNDVGIELRSVVQHLGGDVEDFQSWVQASLPLLQARFDLFTRGVDVAAFDRFMLLTPYTIVRDFGRVEQYAKRDRAPPSRDDARFCIDFAVDSALALRDHRVSPAQRATEVSERVRVKSSCEVLASWKGKDSEVIRVAEAGEELTVVAPASRRYRPDDYVAIIQDGDTAYVRRECVEDTRSP